MQKLTTKEETLPEEQKVYRARVVLSFMEAGIPLSKLDCPCFEEATRRISFPSCSLKAYDGSCSIWLQE